MDNYTYNPAINQMNQVAHEIGTIIDSMVVDKILMVVTPPHRDMFHRPIQVQGDHGTLDHFQNVLYNTMSVNAATNEIVNPESIKPMASLVAPSTVPTNRVTIAEGWGATRLRFLMSIRNIENGTPVVYYLQGYSAYYDPSYTGKIDEHMPLYINTVIRTVEAQTPNGPAYFITHSNNVLFDPNTVFGMNNVGLGNNAHSARPYDVFAGIEALDYTAAGVDFIENRTLLTAKPTASHKRYNRPTTYLAEIIDKWLKAKSSVETTNNTADMLSAAQNAAYVDSLVTNPLFRALASISDTMSANPYITLSDIMELDPTIIQNNKITLIQSKPEGELFNPLDTQDMSQATVENALAHQIVTIVASIMSDLMVTKLNFLATNVSGEDLVQVLDRFLFINAINSNIDVKLLSMIERDLIPVLSIGGSRIYSINVFADMLGDTYLELSLNGGPSIPYVIPTFADSLFSPIVMPSESVFNGVVHDMERFISAASEVYDSLELNMLQSQQPNNQSLSNI